jgi:HTH-type transcriptional regulator, competence development regulator
MTELGSRLASVRKVKGLSLRGTARDAGISPPYLQKIERGEVKQPSPSVLHGLAGALGIKYGDLMELAGYLLPARTRGSASVNVLAQALSADDLSAEELEQLAEYLAFMRRDRHGSG